MTDTATREMAANLQPMLPSLRRFAGALTRNSADADDLVQACVLRALTRAHLWQPGTNLLGWLFRIMRNLRINDLRHRKVTGFPCELRDDMMVISPPQEASLEFADCRGALGALPPNNLRILQLIAWDGLSYDETARRMNMPIGTIRSRLSRTRQTLRDRLAGE